MLVGGTAEGEEQLPSENRAGDRCLDHSFAAAFACGAAARERYLPAGEVFDRPGVAFEHLRWCVREADFAERGEGRREPFSGLRRVDLPAQLMEQVTGRSRVGGLRITGRSVLAPEQGARSFTDDFEQGLIALDSGDEAANLLDRKAPLLAEGADETEAPKVKVTVLRLVGRATLSRRKEAFTLVVLNRGD